MTNSVISDNASLIDEAEIIDGTMSGTSRMSGRAVSRSSSHLGMSEVSGRAVVRNSFIYELASISDDTYVEDSLSVALPKYEIRLWFIGVTLETKP